MSDATPEIFRHRSMLDDVSSAQNMVQKRFGKNLSELTKPEEFEAAMLAAGRRSAPMLMDTWEDADCLTPAVLRAILQEAWGMPDFPLATVPRRTWILWFRRAGFISDKALSSAERPLRVYRGCEPRYLRGMSWSPDLATATWFANRTQTLFGRAASIFEGIVQPRGILAAWNARGDAEPEIVADPRYITEIRILEPPGASAVTS